MADDRKQAERLARAAALVDAADRGDAEFASAIGALVLARNPALGPYAGLVQLGLRDVLGLAQKAAGNPAPSSGGLFSVLGRLFGGR